MRWILTGLNSFTVEVVIIFGMMLAFIYVIMMI
jgi:hypothetical protein